MHTRTRTWACTRTHTCTHACMCTHARTHARTHAHTIVKEYEFCKIKNWVGINCCYSVRFNLRCGITIIAVGLPHRAWTGPLPSSSSIGVDLLVYTSFVRDLSFEHQLCVYAELSPCCNWWVKYSYTSILILVNVIYYHIQLYSVFMCAVE